MKANITRELAKYNCSMCGRGQEIMDKGICAPSCLKEFVLDDEIEKELTDIEGKASKQTPLKVIKTATSSQACPMCEFDVSWNYCPNCGQAIKY